MKHQYLEFQIQHQRIKRTDSFFVVGGSVNYLKARFSFCEDWAGKEQIAIFTGGGHSYAVSLNDGECFVPWEVLLVKRFYVGCMAGERITSNAVAIDVCPCAVGDNLESPLEPTPTVLDEKIAKAVEQYMKDHPIVDDGSGNGNNSNDGSNSDSSNDADDNIYIQPDEPADAPDGSLWIDTDEYPAPAGGSIFVQQNEPSNAPDGSIWIDTDEDPAPGPVYVTQEAMEDYVDSAIAAALREIPVAEEGSY